MRGARGRGNTTHTLTGETVHTFCAETLCKRFGSLQGELVVPTWVDGRISAARAVVPFNAGLAVDAKRAGGTICVTGLQQWGQACWRGGIAVGPKPCRLTFVLQWCCWW